MATPLRVVDMSAWIEWLTGSAPGSHQPFQAGEQGRVRIA